jgi:hypothetical protein
MPITYQALVTAGTSLEHQLEGNSTWPPERVPDPIREWVQPEDGNVQYFSVDTTTRDDSRSLPVVVSVGADYSQGPNQLANGVEANLGAWRRGLGDVLDRYRQGIYPLWWQPGEWTGQPLELFSELPINIPKGYHYIMTNFSPWITRDPWSDLRGTEATKQLLLHPPGNVPWSDYLRMLREMLPSDTLWAGHGNYDIHQLFMELVGNFQLDRWLFSSNLGGNTIVPWLNKVCAADQRLSTMLPPTLTQRARQKGQGARMEF